MDAFKNKAADMMGSGGVDDHLKDISFPASKDEVIRQLEGKSVPDQVLDKVRNVDTSRFDSLDDLKSRVGL